MASDTVSAIPSPYALARVASFDYIKLWYFCTEGCADAMVSIRSADDDLLGLVRSDGLTALRPVAAHRASRNALSDKNLTWEQLSFGKLQYLKAIYEAGWPEELRSSLANFFVNLESHMPGLHFFIPLLRN